ncbi:hypothetical protein BO99DRAFT_321342 [Aspergillus violaceofuscus CBS 115571]|uniref:Uncharacterized protein n=1 Tax=Aspergillus violaceofuscus (strain CBS 115571) TaxID=1450538 RepID=A0A2V5HIY0_ASPV1|nr:hypothetical protein BO99DRAFT_321342 [Aspergillus violaceofuscus CBS 115571]
MKSTKTLEELVMGKLWKVALEELREKDGRLVAAYEKDLVSESSKNQGQDGERQIESGRLSKPEPQQELVREALQRLEDGQLVIPRRCRQTAIGNHVQLIVQIILSVKDVISQAVSAEPHASLAWAGVLVVLPLLLKPFTQLEEAAKGIEFISRLLIRYQVIQSSHIQVFIAPPGKSERMTSVDRFCSSIREQTISLFKQVLEYQIRLARQFSRSGLFQGIRDMVTADDWLGMTTNVEQIDKSIHTMLAEWSQKTIQHIDATVASMQEKMDKSLSLAIGIKKDMNIQHNEALLKSMTCVTSAAYGFYDQDKGTCLEGTQVAVLEKIQQWSIGSEEKPILWLQGMAGTGKSTIARTAAAAFRNGTLLTSTGALPDNVCFGGSFFFDHKKQDCKDPRNLFPTLARQLVEVIPEIQDAVCAAIANHHDIQQRTLRDQWRYLIWQPLSMLQSDLQDTVMVVIDALDECEVKINNYKDDLEVILGLLSQIHQLRFVRIRVLITSRPEADMQRHSKSLSQNIHDQTLKKVKLVNSADDREDDITRLIKHEMVAIKKSHPRLPADWPGTQSLRQLVVQTEGLFIYASTVCRFLRDATERTIQRRLDRILDNGFDGNSKGNNLDEMYNQILEIILTGETDNDEEMSNLFNQVVGCIIVLSQPMSLMDLGDLVPCQIDDIRWILGQLCSVIEVSQNEHQPIQLVHLSFRDFLLDHSRCKNDLFYLEEKEPNHVVFEHCLELMSCYLRRDICCLREPGIELSQINLESLDIKKRFPDSVRYACIYWAEHLERSGDASPADEARTLGFLETHFIHWLEAMCLVGMVPQAINTFNVLTSMDMSQKMSNFIFEARRFTTKFRLHIEKMPLQIYTSALPCAPQNSVVRKLFEEEIPTWITQLPEAQSDWSAFSHNLGTLEIIRSLEFSFDEKLLLVGSGPKARLFETATWTCVLEIDGDSSSGFGQIVLSADSTRLAAWFGNGNARLWHVWDGRWVDVEAHPARIVGTQFSGDGVKLVCLLDDNTMLIADGHTGDILAKLSHGVAAVPVSNIDLMYFNLAVFNNCRLIAIVDEGKCINVFDQTRDSIVYSYCHYPGRRGTIRPLTFSPDGKLLLSASTNGYVVVWDSDSDKLHEVEAGDMVLKAAFLADSTAIAIIYEDLTVSTWIWETGQIAKQEIDRSGQNAKFSAYCRVSFPESSPVVTCMTSDRPDGLWKDIQTTCAQINRKCRGGNTAIALSPNGRFIASSQGSDVAIWEVSAQESQNPSAEDDGTLVSVEVSPDGNSVASCYLCAVKLRNGNTGELRETWTVSPNSFYHHMSFSADSRVFLLGSYDGQVLLWDVVSGQPLTSIQVSNLSDPKIALSPDKTLLALASSGWTDSMHCEHIILWDLVKNKALREFKLFGEPEHVAISPDNGTIAVSSRRAISMYSSAGTILHSVNHGGENPALAFSASGELIASADEKFTIWNAATGQKLGDIPCDRYVSWICFTDGDRSLSTSEGRFSTASILANDLDMTGSGLVWRGLYIMNGRKRILALNSEFLASSQSVRGGKVSLVFPPDRVGILGIDTEVDHIL